MAKRERRSVSHRSRNSLIIAGAGPTSLAKGGRFSLMQGLHRRCFVLYRWSSQSSLLEALLPMALRFSDREIVFRRRLRFSIPKPIERQ